MRLTSWRCRATMLRLGATSVFVAVLAGCGGLLPTPTATQTGMTAVRTHVTADAAAASELSLEIGGSAWSVRPDGGDGVVIVYLDEPAPTRLLDVTDCAELLSFEARPNWIYDIVIGTAGMADVDAHALGSNEAVAFGPGLNARAQLSC